MPDSESHSIRFLPLGVDVQGRNCIVVGGGRVGARKAINLVAAGANVTVVSPAISSSLATQLEAGCFTWVRDTFREEQLNGAFMVVAATDDQELNARIVAAGAEAGALVCDASSAHRSQIIFGALHRCDDGVTVAVFTDGRDPTQARRFRDRIAQFLEPDRDLEGHTRPD